MLTCEGGRAEEPEFGRAEVLLQALDRPHHAEHGELAHVLVAPLLHEGRHPLQVNEARAD